MKPTIGRIVHYKLSAQDAEEINGRRTDSNSIRTRTELSDGHDRVLWPQGAQAHIGNHVREGQILPMIITAVWPTCVSGQVFLDGNDTFWAMSRNKGTENGNWFWPLIER